MMCTLMNSLQARAATLALGAAMIALAMISGASAQQSFKTPEEAVETLVTAIRAGDNKTVNEILGPGAEQIMSSGDAVQDENTRRAFLAGYGLARSFCELFREPDPGHWLTVGPLTAGIFYSLPMIATGIYMMWTAGQRGPATSNVSP